ncbi:MAG: hypothetical protein IKA53_01260 [Clostridia bacterium]|nr:hypothetical protein [Clostridia bacterium]MBR2324652.1 hypothetical protein [Clostridia bacterium]
MYAKRINKYRILCPDRPYLVADGRIYTNPTTAQLQRQGYKPLVEKEPCPEGEHYVYYEEDEKNVYICYGGREEYS